MISSETGRAAADDATGRYAPEWRAACQAALRGGHAAAAWYGAARGERKSDGSPVSAADRAAHDAVLACIGEAFPEDAVRSEEGADGAHRAGAERLWVVDPLDGTREFLASIPEFAVMVGFVERGRAVAGAVYLPAERRLFSAAEGQGAWVEEADGSVRRLRLQPSSGPPRMVGSRSHAEPAVLEIAAALGCGAVQPCGSVGVKCARLTAGEFDLYLHPSPHLKEWDTCAPEVLVREAGGTVTCCAGEPLEYGKAEPRQAGGFAACGPGLLDRVRPHLDAGFAALAGNGGSRRT